MTQSKINRTLIAMIAGTALFASCFNLGYFSNVFSNFLPVQLALSFLSLALLLRPAFISVGVYTVVLACTLMLSVYNVADPKVLITNPVLPNIILMGIIAGTQFQIRNRQTLLKAVAIVLSMLLVMQFFTNLTFAPTDHSSGRFKGYGSGTAYSLLAAYSILYIAQKYSRSELTIPVFIVLLLIPVWTIYLTQSRGVLLSIVLVFILKNATRLKSHLKMLLFLLVPVVIVLSNPQIIAQIPVLERLDWRNYSGLQQFSSNRLTTQSIILDWISTESSFLALLFGAAGLNGIKSLAEQGLEFPHFDLLYLFYDGGIVAVAVYLGLAVAILRGFKNREYFLMFFISGLHTNMVLSPTFLFLSLLLTLEDDIVTARSAGNRRSSDRPAGRHRRPVPNMMPKRSYQES